MTYEVINAVTTNTLAAFDSMEAAEAARESLAAASEEFGQNFIVVAFDDDGLAMDPTTDVVAGEPTTAVRVVRSFGRDRVGR